MRKGRGLVGNLINPKELRGLGDHKKRVKKSKKKKKKNKRESLRLKSPALSDSRGVTYGDPLLQELVVRVPLIPGHVPERKS